MRTSKTVQEYVGCLLSMARATIYDHATYSEAIDQESLDKALDIVHKIMTNEMLKNKNRECGSWKHISEVD